MALRYWLVVQPLDRARRQIDGGYVQLPWGRLRGLDAMRESDGVALYAPRQRNPDGEPLRAVVATGRVRDGAPYRAEAGRAELELWRLRVAWDPEGSPAPIRPLRDHLELTRAHRFWGEQLRDGLTELSRRDFEIMRAAVARPAPEPSRLGMGLLREPPGRAAPRTSTVAGAGDDDLVLGEPW